LLMRFVDERFREDYDATIGVEFGSKILNISNYVIKTQIWDTVITKDILEFIHCYSESFSARLDKISLGR